MRKNEEIKRCILLRLKSAPSEIRSQDIFSWVEFVMPSARRENIRAVLLTLIEDGVIELTASLGLKFINGSPQVATGIQMKFLGGNSHIGYPTYATPGSAGMDLCSAESDYVTLSPGQSSLFNTGIAIFIADPNYAGLVLPRSGLGHKHGIVLSNSVGLIDSDYQGQLKVSLRNTSRDVYNVFPGDKIAQLVIVPVAQVKFSVVEEFSVPTKRGVGGFGSTGV